MSITVRSWSDAELEKVKNGKDKWLTTVFMNGSTFSEKQIKSYPYHLRKKYVAELDCDEETENVEFYATDDKNAKRFLNEEYTCKPASIDEVITKYRKVKL